MDPIAILSLGTSVVALLNNLKKENHELDRNYFDTYITPIWRQFDAIHNDYKCSFMKYIKIASRDDYEKSMLIAEIERDILYTKDLRRNLKSLIHLSPYNSTKQSEKLLREFIRDIYNYFDFSGQNDGLKNISRDSAIQFLESANEGSDAKRILDAIIADNQEGYERVSISFSRLRGYWVKFP